MGGKRIQSATEYILTYGWAFLIAAVVVASLYLFVFAPSTIAQSACTFFSGPYCQDIVLGTSGGLSKIALLLTNTQPYPILDPVLVINMSGIAPISTICSPNVVLAGGAIICSATVTPTLSQGTLASGTFILSYTPCPGGSASACHGTQRQNFAGNFDTHASQLLSPTTISLTLSVQNSSQVALATSFDKITATVKMLGTPLSGATVNFTSNSVNAGVNPLVTTTDGSGNAYTYISSGSAGNVLISATFANQIANTVITFTPPVCYTISTSAISGASGNIVTIDGIGYSSLPQQLCYGQGVSHSYSFQATVAGAAGIQYVFNGVSGCGATTQSGTLMGVANCTLNGNYTTQYFLTTSASPGAGGSVTPASGWYNAGNSATLGETPNAGYAFNGFTGTGSGSYTGASTTPSITLNNPITETGSFTSTSTSTTSTTSTTTTSTTTTIQQCSNTQSGTCNGDITYSSNTQLSGNVIALNMILVQNAVILDECGKYIQANVALYNYGTINDTCSGGSAGSGGGSGSAGTAGSSGSTRTSNQFSVSLVSGKGGAGGGGGGYGSTCSSGCVYGGDPGGNGAKGGGVVEIYAKNLVNSGNILANGYPGNQGWGAAQTHGGCIPCFTGQGGGGGGQGGSGGTILYAYTTITNTGTISASAGTNAGGGSDASTGAGATSAGGGAGGSGSQNQFYPGGYGPGGPGGVTAQISGNTISRTWP